MSKKETLEAIKEAKEHIASIKNGAQITETVDLSNVDAMLKSCGAWKTVMSRKTPFSKIKFVVHSCIYEQRVLFCKSTMTNKKPKLSIGFKYYSLEKP